MHKKQAPIRFKNFLILVSVFLSFNSFAQTGKGYLLVAVKPDDAIIRLDTALVQQQMKHFPVDTGRHIIKAWAHGRKLVVDTLDFTENTSILFRKKLEYTDEYKDYRHKKHSYNTSKIGTAYFPGLFTISISIAFFITHKSAVNKSEDYLNDAITSKEKYENLTDEAEIHDEKEIYSRHKSNYDEQINRANKISTSAKIIIPTGIVVTGVLYYFSTKLVKPVFNEQPALSGLSLDYQLTGQYTGPRINYNLKF